MSQGVHRCDNEFIRENSDIREFSELGISCSAWRAGVRRTKTQKHAQTGCVTMCAMCAMCARWRHRRVFVQGIAITMIALFNPLTHLKSRL